MIIYIVNSLKYFPKKIVENSLIITNSYEVCSYAIKNGLNFKEFSEIVQFKQCSRGNVHDYFEGYFNQTNDDDEYLHCLKYSLSNQIKAIELAVSFSETLCLNYDIDQVFVSYDSSPSFKREKIDNFLVKLISFHLNLKKIKVVNIRKTSRILEIFLFLPFVILPHITKGFFIFEKLFKYFKYFRYWRQKRGRVQRTDCEVLSFASGTDTRYIAKFFDKLGTKSKLNIQSESIHKFKSSAFQNSVRIESFYLQNILSVRQFVKIKRSDIITLLSNNERSMERFFSDNRYFVDYIFFRILRDGFQIDLYRNIIEEINPDVVISGSLYLPLIAANSLRIKTASIVEGLGIGENPIAPQQGIHILSPNQFTEDQIKNQYDNKSYHIVGHDLYQ